MKQKEQKYREAKKRIQKAVKQGRPGRVYQLRGDRNLPEQKQHQQRIQSGEGNKVYRQLYPGQVWEMSNRRTEAIQEKDRILFRTIH